MKFNMNTPDEKRRLKVIIKEIFIAADLDGDGLLNKEEISIGCQNNAALKQLIQLSVNQVKDVNKKVQSDLEEQFHTFIPISANLITYKEGIHFPLQASIMDMTR